MIVVGIGGVARSGKNLLCELLRNSLTVKGFSSKQFALASELKEDCKDFLFKKCDMDVWTDLTEDKNRFRDFLVWYGDLKRKQSDGRYWIDRLDRRVSTYKGDVAFVTDVRYDHYEKDEVHWIKEEKQGLLIHLKRFERDGDGLMSFTKPANDHESLNDVSLYTKAHINITWETAKNPHSDFTIMETVGGITEKIIKKLKETY